MPQCQWLQLYQSPLTRRTHIPSVYPLTTKFSVDEARKVGIDGDDQKQAGFVQGLCEGIPKGGGYDPDGIRHWF